MKFNSIFKTRFQGLFLFALAVYVMHLQANAQHVEFSNPAKPSVALEVISQQGGMLIPRLSNAQRDALPSPETGLLIFNLTSERLNFWTGSAWNELGAMHESNTTGAVVVTSGVAINNDGVDAAPSAALDIASTTKGLLLPRTTPGSILNPEAGMLIFNTLTTKPNYYNGSDWAAPSDVQVSTLSGAGSSPGGGFSLNLSGAQAPNSAMLELAYADKSLLLPRMSDAERNAINPAIGLIVYNSTVNKVQYYTSGGWFSLFTTIPQPSVITGDAAPWQFASTTYSVENVPGTTYTWTVPADWSITAGQGTNQITVTTGGVSGDVEVTPAVGGSNGPSRSSTVSVKRAFISNWKTDNILDGGSAANQVSIPLFGNGYNFTVYWGDGTSQTHTANPGNISHVLTKTYAVPGTYAIKITGDFPRIYANNYTDRLKLLSIGQWGDIAWSNMSRAFYGFSNLNGTFTDAPNLTNVTDLSFMFSNAGSFNWDISNWDVSHVTNMRYMFRLAEAFNQALNGWDVSRVTNMSSMFASASAFNMPLDNWVVSSVTDMSSMFQGATMFNRDISNWNVSSVTDMRDMFSNTPAFNGDLSDWNVSSVTDMSDIFSFATAFNGDISTWNVSNVTKMRNMFENATMFSGNISNWDVSSVTDMDYMFENAVNFNSDISNWNVMSVATMEGMFYNCPVFNKDLSNWCVSAIPAEPTGFSSGCIAWVLPKPVWGTCGVFVINGISNPWELASTTYNVVNVPGTTYTWSVPAGWVITAGQGTNQITVTTGEASGNVEVVPSVGGISGPTGTLVVNVKRGLISTWKTDNILAGGSAANQVSIPLFGNGYNFTVYWGDGTSQTHTANPGNISHVLTKTYAVPGTYAIKITGDFPRIYANNYTDRLKLLSIGQWGDIAWSNMSNAFNGCSNLNGTYNDAPDLTNVTDLSYMFSNASSFNWDISNWDVSHVTNMRYMFRLAEAFNQALNGWDVSRVTNMSSMFASASAFNMPLDNWVVSSVTDMNNMFYKASAFNQPLDGWDVSKVTDMSAMFSFATTFNQAIGSWDVSSVTNMSGMFAHNKVFNQPIGNWNVSKVTSMSVTFALCESFNQDISNWDVSNVTNMFRIFMNAYTFNQPIEKWNVSKVTNMEDMLMNCRAFNRPIGSWDVSKVTNMSRMLYGTNAFNNDISGWNVSNVTNMYAMFQEALVFNQNLSTWCVSLIPAKPTSFDYICPAWVLSRPVWGTCPATSISGESNPWQFDSITYNVTNIPGTTYTWTVPADWSILSGQGTNQIIAAIGSGSGKVEVIPSVGGVNGQSKLLHVTVKLAFITTWKTDNILEGGSGLNEVSIPMYGDGYDFTVYWGDGSSQTYTANPGPGVLHNLTKTYAVPGTYNIKITGDFSRIYFNSNNDRLKLLSINQWGDIAWTSMGRSFYGCSNLNGTFTDVPNLTNVPDLSYMFSGAGLFNEDISSWDVSNVTYLHEMFSYATSFNQPLGNWNVSKVTNMNNMFDHALAFNQPLNNWNTASLMHMQYMFSYASAFNKPLENWNTSKVISGSYLFYGASSFNQPVGSWDVSGMTILNGMFKEATAFDQPLGNWNVSNATNMYHMFMDASSFNHDISSWNVSKVTLMSSMFNGATSFNSNIGGWDVSSVSNMYNMFQDAASFNQNLSHWCVSLLPSEPTGFDTGANSWVLPRPVWGSCNILDITGSMNPWQLTSSTYSVQNEAGTTYTWTVPADWAITAGQGTNQITVTIGGSSGDVEVISSVGGVNVSSGVLQVTVKRAFITTWKTDNTLEGGSGANQLSIPLYGNGYNFTVYWGDGSSQTHVANPGDTITHYLTKTYAAPGTYTINITGAFPHIYMKNNLERLKLTAINQWGDIAWASMQNAFDGCSNLIGNYIDAPDLSNVTSMKGMFAKASLFDSDLSNWNVSNVSDMSYLFIEASLFNHPPGDWDVSNVTDMSYMFYEASAFNQPLENWDVSKVTNMRQMFYFASSFDQPIANWNVASVTNMYSMFRYAAAFNQSLGSWDVSNVTDMSYMFSNASSFNGDISNWNVSKVTNMSFMFRAATAFNQAIGSWNVSSVTSMTYLFGDASSFNQPIGSWDVSSVADMSALFRNATAFNQSIANWNVSNVTDMSFMFLGASAFDGDIANWNVSKVANMRSMFSNATSFNHPIGSWNVSAVTNMSYMFLEAVAFDQFIGNWNVSSVTDMSYMFHGAAEFNQPIGNWNVSSVTDMRNMFFTAGSFNQPIGNWNVSSVTNMLSMFHDAVLFNQEIGNWNVSSVTDMSNMFSGAAAFNKNIGNWNVASVTLMGHMFSNAIAFNQPIGNWVVPDVVDMSYMFLNASAFNQDLSVWCVSLISAKPEGFDAGAFNWLLPQPIWGSCSSISISGNINPWQLVSTTYSVVNVPGTTYTWSVPAGWTITAGQGTNQITVTIGGTTGIVHVVASVGGVNGQFGRLNVNVKRAFISTWKTTNTITGGSTSKQVRIPLYGNGYNFKVYWGDGTSQTYTANPGINSSHSLTKTYAVAGTYTVTITGEFPRIFFQDGNEKLKLLSITQWGDIVWSNMESAFFGCSNFNGTFTDAPNLSNVTNMAFMFCGASTFNWDITNWDVSSVTNMTYLFNQATAFNQPIGNWDVSNVTNMSYVFGYLPSFNQPLNGWDVSKVTDMSGIFSSASSFNQHIGNWNVSSVRNMTYMFSSATSFNQPIGSWNVSNVTLMTGTFLNATSFNQDISGWNVSNVINMYRMFYFATVFNQPIGNWNVSNVTNMNDMFMNASAFNQPIGNWDVSKVTSMSSMFYSAKAFNRDISGWDVSHVTNMYSMFNRAEAFNQDLSGWCVSLIPAKPSGFDSGATSWILPKPVWGTCP